METISDIVAEMRAKTAKSKDEAWYDKKKWEELCNRIKVAHKRELEDAIAYTIVAAAKSASEVYEPHIKSDRSGNVAKMFEALEAVVKVGYPHNFQREAPHIRVYCYEITTAIEKCFAALAEPLRNCDVGTAEEQEERYLKLKREYVDRMARCPAGGYSFFPDSLYWAQLPYEDVKK
jgi:hypothetical protein